MNGTFVSQHLMGSSVAVAKSCGATLHAWFLIHGSSIGDMDYAFPNDLRLTENVLTGKSIAQEDEELLKANITLFEDACREARVPYVIEAEHYISLRKFLHHTAFADFVIADARATIDQFGLAGIVYNSLIYACALPLPRPIIYYCLRPFMPHFFSWHMVPSCVLPLHLCFLK